MYTNTKKEGGNVLAQRGICIISQQGQLMFQALQNWWIKGVTQLLFFPSFFFFSFIKENKLTNMDCFWQ